MQASHMHVCEARYLSSRERCMHLLLKLGARGRRLVVDGPGCLVWALLGAAGLVVELHEGENMASVGSGWRC